MNFTDPKRISQVVWAMKEADLLRAQNRSRINALFNGEVPYTDKEARESSIETNVNFLEATRIAQDARNQFGNAFLKTAAYFTVNLDWGPQHLRRQWSHEITKLINRPLKRSLPYMETLRATHAQAILHGIGPVMWRNRHSWCPYPINTGEVMLPSGTLVDLDNLDHFAVFRRYTHSQLYRDTHGPAVDKGWNLAEVNRILASLSKAEMANALTDWTSYLFPEKTVEDWKSNSGYWGSDAIPTLNVWDFYFRAEDDPERWHRRIISDSSTTAPDAADDSKFLFDPGSRVYAERHSELVHFQFADGASVAPFRVHSIRSLGYVLFAVCHLNNRLRCRFNDAVMESMNWYFRNVNADDRERLMAIDLHNKGVIPEGLTFVKPDERHTISENLMVAAFNQNRQLMSENSASYVQDVDIGSENPDETATKTMARMNTSSAMLSGMLNLAYIYQAGQYREIARRFCLPGNADPDVKEFRARCLEAGIPEEALDINKWDIEPDRVVGGGNKTLEMAQINMLMQTRNLFDPQAQQDILRDWTLVVTGDPDRAVRYVPIQQLDVSDGAYLANLAMGTLMQGLPVAIKRGVSHIDYVEMLLTLMGQEIQKIEQAGGMTAQDKIEGLVNVMQHVQQHISIIGQDPREKSRVKGYQDALAKMMNMVKAYAQRLEEARQQQAQQGAGITPEAAAKIESARIIAGTQASIKAEAAKQKMTHKEVAFNMEQRRKQEAHQMEIGKGLDHAQVDAAATDIKTRANVLAKRYAAFSP